jgi:prolyl oligopeptidase
MHARKMAAALQNASTSGHPILLRSEAAAGHGAGKALHRQVDEYTDLLAFFIAELGLPDPSPSSASAETPGTRTRGRE